VYSTVTIIYWHNGSTILNIQFTGAEIAQLA